MTDAPLTRIARDVLIPLLLAKPWEASKRDKIEGIVAYSLLGAVSCAMSYVALRMAATYFG